MKFAKNNPEPASMQLAPMIDIVFLLLIFFIVTWQYSRSETDLSVSVPTAEEGVQKTRASGEIIINVLPDGSIKVLDVVVTVKDLKTKLMAIAKIHPDHPVRIRGDGGVPYQRIVEVIDGCQKAGIWNISFATQKPPSP